MIALSVLDQSPVPSGGSPADALRDTLALARAADWLGYRRYWLAEHHNTASIAGSAPEILTAWIASQTAVIRVGSGGVLLSHYSPLKVAETFLTLEALFPGRIDLGLGRADGADRPAVAALHKGWERTVDDDYPDRMADLLGYLDATLGPTHRSPEVLAMPYGRGRPEVWVLGSSSYSARLAARLGLPFTFAHFISPNFGPQVMAEYRKLFQASPRCPAPHGSVAVSVVCAETDVEGERLAVTEDVWHLRPEGAGRGPLLSAEDADAYPVTDIERELLGQHRRRRVTGAPDRVHAALVDLADAYCVNELVVRTICHEPADRLRSYQLLAQAFDLSEGESS